VSPVDGLISCLTAPQRARLLAAVDRSAYAAGRTIVWKGEVVSRLFVVERGDVEAAYETPLGPAFLRLGPGDFFGETSVIEGGPSETRVRACADGTLVLDVPAAAFRAVMDENAELFQRFLEAAALRRVSLGASFLGWGRRPAVQ
jgi:CRP-like cAMP-binding protein